MIKIGIVEDDGSCVAQLREHLERYARDTGTVFKTEVFLDGEQIAFDYKPGFDILLMDVEMPRMDGMTAAKLIRRQDPDVIIIFITAMAQYALEGYSVHARAYLLKPVNYVSLNLELQSAIASLSKRSAGYLLLNTEDDLVVKLPEGKILYIETDGHDLIVHASDGTLRVRSTMKDMEARLTGRSFSRPSVSYLVNLAHVSGIRGDMAAVGDTRIPISRQKRKDFVAALTDYVGRS